MQSRAIHRGGFAVVAALFLLITFWVKPAEAYAWMIRHDYTGCNQCHADPSGGALLTEYGRAQSDFLLRMRYGAKESYEPPRSAGFLFGPVKLPESLLLGGDVRYARLGTTVNGNSDATFFLMQADLQGQLSIGRFKMNGSIGYAERGARQAAITTKDEKNIVSRTFWLGAELGKDRNWMLRGGRMNMPFGIRDVEHTMWVRSSTRTDINSSQQYGVALAYNGAELRGEFMVIAGNFQVSPDDFRERGYSGYIEYAATTHLAFGLSSLLTHADKDIVSQESLLRNADGIFGRYNPVKPLVLLAEADLLANASGQQTMAMGYVGMLQADTEFTQGLHVMATGELLKTPAAPVAGVASTGPSSEIWGSIVWFFLPHFDARVDLIWQNSPSPSSSSVQTTTLLTQLHAFL